METNGKPMNSEDAAGVFEFKPNLSYEIGLCSNSDSDGEWGGKLLRTGPIKAITLLGSQIIEEGNRTAADFFKLNAFRLPEKLTFAIYEIDPANSKQRLFGKGTVLPKPIPAEQLSDKASESDGPKPQRSYNIFDQEPRREDPIVRAERQAVDTLRDELVDRDNAMERLQQLMEQMLHQNDRTMEQLKDTVNTLKETTRSRDEVSRSRDEVSQKLAGVEAQVDAILKLREFEERIRKEREEEREQWRARERELEKSQGEKQGLGDVMDQLIPFAPIIQMVLERVLPPMNPYGMPGMPGSGMMPNGMPPGAMPPGMMQGGMQQGGMQQPGTQPNGQQRPPQRPRPSQNGTDGGEGQRNLNII